MKLLYKYAVFDTFPAIFIDSTGSAYRVLLGKPEGKRPLGRPRCRWEDNIKIYILFGSG
jgi:hypothetical protein